MLINKIIAILIVIFIIYYFSIIDLNWIRITHDFEYTLVHIVVMGGSALAAYKIYNLQE